MRTANTSAPADASALTERILPLVGLIAVALALPAFASDLLQQAWTAVYFDSGLFRAFCL